MDTRTPPRRAPELAPRSQPGGWTGTALVAVIGAIVVGLMLASVPTASALISLEELSIDTGDSLLSSTSLTHETPPGEDRLLLVSASWDDSSDVDLSSITYAGNALTCLEPAKQGDVASQMCYLVAPPTGSSTLELSWGLDVSYWAVVARSLNDVDQDRPIGAASLASGDGSSAVATVTTEEPDSTVFGHLGAADASPTLTPAYDTEEDVETSVGLSSLGISAAAGRVNTTTAGDYPIGWNLSSAVAWALEPAEVRRTPEQVFFNASSDSGSEASSPVEVGISMDRVSSGDVKVDYEITGGNASSEDHNLTAGTATIEAGETWTTIELDVTDDGADEPDETVELTLKNPRGGATSSPTTHTYTILDDDPNQVPDPSDASITTDEDASVSDTLSASDPDQNDTIDSFAVATAPSHGNLSLDASTGDYTYTPDADYAGDDSFTFTASDEHGATSATATVEITVNPVNDAPVASNDSASTDEDTAVWIDVLADDSDVDGDTLSVASATSPADGSTSLPGNGTVKYTPDADWNGEDSFTYTVSDGTLTDTATVTITVDAVNDAPVASNDSASTDEDTAVWIDVLADDSDVDGDTLSVASATSPADGSTSLPGNGTVQYTPDADWNGEDSFTYTVTDGTLTDTATVTVTVNPVNDPPVASDDSASTDEDTAVWIDVLADDSDVDGDTLNVASATSPANGTTSIPGNSTVKYTPDADWNGEDSFTYTVTDGTLTDTATVTITVDAVNDAPVASNDSASTDEDTAVTVDVLDDDSDVDGDSLSVASTTSPSDGSLVVNANDSITYTPDADWNGEDSFTYTVTDGTLTDTATVTVTVNPVNDAPVASDDTATAEANETVWIDVLTDDTDVDGDSLTVASTGSAANGSTQTPGNGTIAYTPDSAFTGSDAFTYTVTDGSLTDTATVNVTVNAASGGAEILTSNVRILDDTLATEPSLRTDVSGSSLSLQLENATSGLELASIGASNETTIEINLTVANFTTRALVGRAQVVDWTNTTNEDGTENVSLELRPIPMAFIDDCDTYPEFMGYCGPASVDSWPTNTSEDQADVAFEAGLRVSLSDLSYLNSSMQSRMEGAYIASDAQALGQMNLTGAEGTSGPSLTMPVAGPHTLPDQTTNEGFFEARLPDAVLDWWGIGQARLTGDYEGENRSLEVSNVTEGTQVRMDIHYSSGEATITEDDTPPVADAGGDRTVTAGDSITLDANNATDNQAIANYTWTLGDGTNATGETVEHTYDSEGTYEVVLNVTDTAGNSDEATVNVTVDAASSGGGGRAMLGPVGGGPSDDAEDDEDEPAVSTEPEGTDEAADTDPESASGGGGGTDVPVSTSGEQADDERATPATSDEGGSDDASEPGSPDGSSSGSRLVEGSVEIGVWLVWLVLVPASVIGIRRYA